MKTRLGIIFGGVSNEHDVSLRSARAVVENINKDKYEIYLIGITKDGFFRLCRNTAAIFCDDWYYDTKSTPCRLENGMLIADGVYKPDVIFPVIHGQNCEDGRLQGFLDTVKIPYVGSGCETSAVCMDKAYTKIILERYGIPCADYIVAHSHEKNIAKRAEEKISYPMFVKPARSGSSVGASKACNRNELESAVAKALKTDDKILIEEFISGSEAEVAVCERNGSLQVSPPGEIDSCGDFYDYDTKYKTARAKLYIPARFDGSVCEDLRRQAAQIFRILGCSDLARIDFLVGDKIVFNEINTLPGFTSISMYPQLMCRCGYNFHTLLDALVASAIG